MRPLLPRLAAALLASGGLLAACAHAPPTTTSTGPGASAQPSTAPTAPVAPAAACDAPSCDACTASPACRWCTEPGRCTAASVPCMGLSLGHPSTCANDPKIGGSQRARGIASLRAGLVAELRDMEPGPTIDLTLEKLTSLTFALGAGRCWSLVWSMADDAAPLPASMQFDFVGPKGSQGQTVAPLDLAGWSGRSCTSVAGSFVVTVVDANEFTKLVPAGRGRISFTLYSRARVASDSDEGGGPPLVAPPASTRPGGGPPPRNPGPPRGGRAPGVDCQDCTFPCESAKRDCERRCFVDHRDMGARRTCESVCAQIGRACLRGCPGCI